MKLTLHIGTEKTATTTIQNYLYDNKDSFLDQNTYIVTSLGAGNNRDLVSCAMLNEHFDDYHANKGIFTSEDKALNDDMTIKRFEEELQNMPGNIDNVVISSEQFHSRLKAEKEVFNLKEILVRYFADIKVIVYLRPQVDVLISLYSTIIKSGGKISFEQFISENPKNMLEYYDYKGLLDKWGEIFGDNNIVPRVFEKSSLIDNDIITDFCHCSEIELHSYTSNNLNESLTPLAQEAVRLCNLNGASHYNEIKNKILANKSSYGKGQSLSSIDAFRIQSNYELDNNQLAKKWFSNEVLFDINFGKYENSKNLSDKDKETISLMLQAGVELNEEDINTIRDSALEIEKYNPKLSIALLKIAERNRPTGLFIRKNLQRLLDAK